MPKRARVSEDASSRIEVCYQSGDFLYGLYRPNSYMTQLSNFFARRNPPHLSANDFYSPVLSRMISQSAVGTSNESAFKDDFALIIKNRDYLFKSGGRPVPTMKSDPVRGVAHRRACKLLLIHSSESRRSHFELDGINIARVCHRKEEDLGVTNSELRALYRHTKKHGTNPHVLFYRKGIACPPPWEQPENEKHWQAYDEYRRTKQELAANGSQPAAKRPKP